jgi:hypothetical protein
MLRNRPRIPQEKQQEQQVIPERDISHFRHEGYEQKHCRAYAGKLEKQN